MNTTDFKQYSKTLDAMYLFTLLPDDKIKIIAKANENPKTPENKKILHVLVGSKSEPKDDIDKDGALDLLNRFPVSVTGAWSGDILTGIYAGNKDMVIRIHDTFPVYPNKNALDILRAFPDIWASYLKKLDIIPFFKKLSKETRELWLRLNEDPDRHSSIGEDKQRIEFLQPGTGIILKKLSDEIIENLFTENPNSSDSYYDAYDVYRMVPTNPGSRAERPTLMLFKSMWVITSMYKITTKTDKLSIDVFKGEVVKGIPDSGDNEIIMLDGLRNKLKDTPKGWTQPATKDARQTVGFLVPRGGKLSETDYFKICNKLTQVSENLFSALYLFFKTWPLSGLKSLLQKIIRFRSDVVYLSPQISIPSDIALLATCSAMINHPGSFVPDIQRYVTGLESFTKRLVVSTLEDSSSSDPSMMVSLLAGSLVAQHVKMWKPSFDMVCNWFKFALKALRSKECFNYKLNNYKISQLRPYVISDKGTKWETISALLDNLKSFETDLLMTRWIAKYPDEPKLVGKYFVNMMPIWHCVDHHWAPSVAYFYESSAYVRQQQKLTDITPFAGLFRNIFTFATGINFRRGSIIDDFISNQFYKQTVIAQEQWYLTRFGDPESIPNLKTKHQGSYILDDSWLAGLIGPIELSGSPAKIATLRSNNIYNIAVIKRPSRDMKDSLLTSDQIDNGEKRATLELENGIRLNKATLPDPSFEQTSARLNNGQYYIQKGTNLILWNDAKNIQFSIPEHKAIDLKSLDISEKILAHGKGITIDAVKKIRKMIETMDTLTRSRLIGYIGTFQRRVEMNRISRDGGGTKLATNVLDVDVFHLLCDIARLLPGVLEYIHHLPGTFKIKNAPLWWRIRDDLKDILYPIRAFDMTDWSVDELYDHSDRVLWLHQTETIRDIIHEHKFLRKRGHFLWLKPGSGKTLIILSYLVYMAKEGLLPPYIIYSLPPSAISTIASEISQFRFLVDLLVPLASISNKNIPGGIEINHSRNPRPYRVTLVEHDHLRLCIDQLLLVAPQSVFVIDEVHKALNETKRTSSALEIAQNSYKFVALTGTPVIDNKTYKLIGWFDQIVDFEVNDRNFWVAANSMLAKNMETGIRVINNSISVIMRGNIEVEYQSHVPPSLGGTNTNTSIQDHELASKLSLEVCQEEMIKKTLELLLEGRRVMLVGKDAKHVDILNKLLVKGGIDSKYIFTLVGKESIHLTSKAVKNKEVFGYKVVIVPIKKSEGYTLTYLNVMVTSVYPSNNATREQIRGRIDRLDQESTEIDIYTYHSGILTYILHHHEEALRIGIALAGYSK